MAAEALARVLERIAAAAARAGRSPDEVTLVAVTKARTVPEIMDVYETGHRDFGENRAQELADKVPHLPADIRWHFIGHLQRNKVNTVRPLVVRLHAMDRARLARTWASEPDAPPVLLEVNVGREPQKHGVLPEEARRLLHTAVDEGLQVDGLMAIPPVADRPEDARPHFRALADLAAELRSPPVPLPHLSMGMTDDFEVAVEEGATIVRVGRAIFGPRPGP